MYRREAIGYGVAWRGVLMLNTVRVRRIDAVRAREKLTITGSLEIVPVRLSYESALAYGYGYQRRESGK